MAERVGGAVYELDLDSADFVRRSNQAEQAFRGTAQRIDQSGQRVSGTLNRNAMGARAMGQQFLYATGQGGALNSQLGMMTSSVGSVGIAAAGSAVALGAFVAGVAASVRAFTSFESAFADVKKTVDLTEAEFGQLSDAIRQMSKELPIAVTGLTDIGAIAGQLGISGVRNIEAFIRTVAELTITTGISASEIATALGTITSVMRFPIEEVDRLGSALTALGNNFNSTEQQILDFSVRFAGAAQVLGIGTADVFGISNAFASVGVEAERGGTAIQRILLSIQQAAAVGGDELEVFAAVTNTTVAQFKEMVRNDPTEVFVRFIEGLAAAGEQAIPVLEALGIADARLVGAALSLASAQDLLRDSIESSNQAAIENNATQEEVAKRLDTTSAQFTILKNNINDVKISIGESLNPAVRIMLTILNDAIDGVRDLANAFSDASQRTKTIVVALAALGTPLGLIGSALAVLGFNWKTTWNGIALVTETVVNSIISLVNDLIGALNDAIGGINKLSGVAGALNPFGGAPTIGEIPTVPGVSIPRVSGGSGNLGSDLDELAAGDALLAGQVIEAVGTAASGASIDLSRLATAIGGAEDSASGGATALSRFDRIMQAISDGIIERSEAMELGISDQQAVTLELAAAENELANQRYRQRIELLALSRAYPGLTGEQVRHRIGLGLIAQHIERTGQTIDQFLRDVNAGVLSTAQQAIDALLGGPTRESLQLDLRMAQLRRRRALLIAGGADESEDKRIEKIDREIDALQNVITLRQEEINILRIRAQLADETIRTDRELIGAYTWLIGVVSNFSDAVRNATTFLHDFAGVGRGEPLPQFSHGIDYVPRRMAAIIDPGEAVLTAAENRQRMLGAGTPAIQIHQQFVVNADISDAGMQTLMRRIEQANEKSLRRAGFGGSVPPGGANR